MLDAARYYVALLTVLSFPFAVIFWLIVHPFVGFWRRRGPVVTYSFLLVVAAIFFWATWQVRAPLLAVEYGTGPALWAAALVVYGLAIAVELRCRRHLKLATLVGLPELRAGRGEQVLLTAGIYGQVRHPRYVAVMLGMLAAGLFCNYQTIWIMVAGTPFGLLAIVHFEERELRVRFGAAYLEYSRRVPRFVPGLGG